MRKMKLIAILASLALVTPMAAQASVSECFTTAIPAVDAFHSALKNGDTDAAKGMLDDGVRIFEQGWVERSKAEYVAKHLESDVQFAQATASTVTQRWCSEIGVYSAVVMTEGHTTGTFEGKAVDSITLETMILRRDNKGWHIVHIHWSSRKPKS